jgi:predicted 3-demethylubiquinone-9 3-methyltransferase (glyoxalase superfamily)
MQKITPFLWFDNQAEEAMLFYTGIFKDARQGEVRRFAADTPSGKAGAAMSASFTLNGQDFIALNGGPYFEFTPAISFFIDCEDQEEVDYYWARLSEGGEPSRCGWLKDRFGVSWQVVPKRLGELLQNPDQAKAGRAMQAMLNMVKIDIAALEQAAQG